MMKRSVPPFAAIDGLGAEVESAVGVHEARVLLEHEEVIA